MVQNSRRHKNETHGDPNLPNSLSRFHYNTIYLPKILERIEKTAPPGADLRSWRYEQLTATEILRFEP
jgi:hypothetical protein